MSKAMNLQRSQPFCLLTDSLAYVITPDFLIHAFRRLVHHVDIQM